MFLRHTDTLTGNSLRSDGMKILAVDDDPIFLDLLLEMLRFQGHDDVSIAGSARDALALITCAAQPFDCFLLDIQMPEVNGVELCRSVRGLEAYRRTPIVMITALSGKNFVDAAFSAGATDYVTKPLDRLDLRARMGMVHRLNDERNRSAVLERQASLPSCLTLPQNSDASEGRAKFDLFRFERIKRQGWPQRFSDCESAVPVVG